MARLADGLGLRQELLLDDIESLSGGQRRRVDLIRILFQGPDTMILDEPTNHLDLPAKRWLMEELERFPGAILVVSHDLKLLDRSINKVLHLSDGRLHEFKGTYSSYMVQLEADQSQRERSALLEGREINRLSTLADSMRGSTNRRARIAKSLDKRVERLESIEDRGPQAREEELLPAARPAAVGRGAAAGRRPLRPLRRHDRAREGRTSTAGGATGWWSSAATAPASPACCAAWPACRNPTTGEIELGANVTLGYFAQEHEQVDLGGHRARQHRRHRPGQRDRTPGPARLVRDRRQGGATRCRRPCRAVSGPSWAWPCWPPGRANVLLLDEPTNNLDPSSIEAVGTMLSRVAGDHRGGQPRPLLRGGPGADPRPQAARRDLHPLGRRLPRPGGDEVAGSVPPVGPGGPRALVRRPSARGFGEGDRRDATIAAGCPTWSDRLD